LICLLVVVAMATPASAILAATISTSFAPSYVSLNGTTTLSFTIGNPNLGGTPIGVSFTDNLPAGLVVADPNNLTDDCGGSVTASPGTSSVTLSSGSLDPTAVGKILLFDADDGIHGQELWRYRP
jgi:hypothetical protein